jgi:hypothetical protein
VGHGLTKLFAGVGVLVWQIGLQHEQPSCERIETEWTVRTVWVN